MSTEKKEKVIIPPYKGKGQITIENWIKFFERLTTEQADDRPTTIIQYLEEEALNFFIERELHNETWENIKNQLINYFSSSEVFSMQEFLNLSLTECENMEEYYRKKTDAATKLKIDEKFLVQILINGLPHELKTLNLTKTFTNSNEWILFNKPLYYHLKTQENSQHAKKEENYKMTPRGIPNMLPNANYRFRFNQYNAPRRYQDPPFQTGYRRQTPQIQNPFDYSWRPPVPYFPLRWPQRFALPGTEPQNSNAASRNPGVLSQTGIQNSTSMDR